VIARSRAPLPPLRESTMDARSLAIHLAIYWTERHSTGPNQTGAGTDQTQRVDANPGSVTVRGAG
jgi:hypothetical protein